MSDRHRHDTPNEEWKRELAGSMRRLNEQLKSEQWRSAVGESVRTVGEQFARVATQEALYHATRALDRVERRRARKEARRQRKRQQAAARTSAAEGYASIIAAIAVVAVIFLIHQEWWLIFIALPLMFRGVRILSLKTEAKAALPENVASIDSRAARIDEVCDKLLAALKDAPPVVRELLSTPEQTVNALRTSYHALLKRENALRALANPEEAARLDRERSDLEARIARESDDVIRTRLQAALVALDHQRSQHAEVLRNANRLEAERTRLGYTLDGLYAQVMRVRTAEAGSEDVAGAGLRHSLDQLRDEVGALADALEQVNQAPPSSTVEQQSSSVRQPERTRS